MDESARRSLNNSRDYFLAFLNQAIFEIGVDLDGPILPPLVATSLLVLSALGLLAKSLAFVAARLDADASLASGLAMNQRYTKLYTNGQLPVNNLLNPYSWAKLIRDWKEGKLKRE